MPRSWLADPSASGYPTPAGDLDLIMHVISQARPWLLEPALVPIPWAPHRPLPPKLRVGFYVSDGVVTPQPPIRRAMDAALEALRSRSDVELVPYEPFRHAEANALIVSLCRRGRVSTSPSSQGS